MKCEAQNTPVRRPPRISAFILPLLAGLLIAHVTAEAAIPAAGEAPPQPIFKAGKIATAINAINLNPLAENVAEERGIELRENISGTRTVYSARYQGTDGRELRVVIPEASYQKLVNDMSGWFKLIEASSSPRRLISCRDRIAMVKDSKSISLCLDGLDDKQRPLFQNWYADVRNLIRANEW